MTNKKKKICIHSNRLEIHFDFALFFCFVAIFFFWCFCAIRCVNSPQNSVETDFQWKLNEAKEENTGKKKHDKTQFHYWLNIEASSLQYVWHVFTY